MYADEIRAMYENQTIVALSESRCNPHDNLVFYDTNVRSDNRGAPMVKFSYLNRLHFGDVVAKDQFLPIRDALVIPYYYQPTASIYTCPHISEDLTKVNTLKAVWSILRYETLPLLNNIHIDQETYISLQEIENKILSSENILYEHDVVELLNILVENFKPGTKNHKLSLDLLKNIEDALLLYKTRTENFDELIKSYLTHENSMIPVFFNMGDEISFPLLFTARSTPLLTYMAFNTTVIENTPLIFTTYTDNIGTSKFVRYEEIEKKYSKETIVESIKTATKLFDTLRVETHQMPYSKNPEHETKSDFFWFSFLTPTPSSK